VHLDLASGEVLAVVATVAEGRYLVSVSGTPDAAVYVTAAEGTDLKAYLRLRGEQRGTPITGLPGDVEDVLAQG
jgi:subtilisin family serine protease